MSSLSRRHRRSFLDDSSFSGMNGYNLGSSELSSLLSTSDTSTNSGSSFATQLSLSYASRANCTQRKGRAGRTQGGICYRLFTRHTYDALPSFPVAEIHRVSLTQVLLKLLFLGYQSPKLTLQSFIEPPSSANVEVSMVQLQDLGAVTREEQLTPLGKYLSQLPCDPRIGKMIMMGAVLNCLDSVLTLAATVDAKPYISNREESMLIRTKKYLFARGAESDQISLLNAFNAFCAMHEDRQFAIFNALHIGNLYTISKYKMQYRDILLTSGFFTYDELQPLESNTENNEESAMNDVNSKGSRYRSEADSVIEPIRPSYYVSQLCIDKSKLSRDALDVALVKACVCCSLFPNLAMLDVSSIVQKGKMIKKLSLKTKTHKNITPAKESVCRRAGGPMSSVIPEKEEYMKQFKKVNNSNSNSKEENGNVSMCKPVLPAMFYVYQDIFSLLESKREFLTNVSAVSLWAILLFGASETKMEYYAPLGLCVIDGWILVRIAPETYFTLNNLRQSLNSCIWRKYQQPANSDNNNAIDKLRVLSKEVLKLPLCNNNITEGIDGDTYCYRNITDNWQRLVDGGVIISPTAQEDERMLNPQIIKNNKQSGDSISSSETIANNVDSKSPRSDREFLLYATRVTPVEEDEIDA